MRTIRKPVRRQRVSTFQAKCWECEWVGAPAKLLSITGVNDDAEWRKTYDERLRDAKEKHNRPGHGVRICLTVEGA